MNNAHKVLILILGTHNERYLRPIETILSTYLSDVPEGFDYRIYFGARPLSESSDLCPDKSIILDCEDSLYFVSQKTWLAYEYIVKSGLIDDFDFIIRPSLSSYVNTGALKEFLSSKPKFEYCSSPGIGFEKFQYPSGCGYIVSKDIIKRLITDKDSLSEFSSPEFAGKDDVALGSFLKKNGINIENFGRFDAHLSKPIQILSKNQLNNIIFRCRKSTAASPDSVNDMLNVHFQIKKSQAH